MARLRQRTWVRHVFYKEEMECGSHESLGRFSLYFVLLNLIAPFILDVICFC